MLCWKTSTDLQAIVARSVFVRTCLVEDRHHATIGVLAREALVKLLHARTMTRQYSAKEVGEERLNFTVPLHMRKGKTGSNE